MFQHYTIDPRLDMFPLTRVDPLIKKKKSEVSDFE